MDKIKAVKAVEEVIDNASHCVEWGEDYVLTMDMIKGAREGMKIIKSLLNK